MNNSTSNANAKKVKTIAAVVYLAVLSFVVGGTYLHQHSNEAETAAQQQAKP